MTPLTFEWSITLRAPVDAVWAAIVSEVGMRQFVGAGPVPAIVGIELPPGGFSTPGGRIRVTNSDGSRHDEVILRSQPPSFSAGDPAVYSIRLEGFTSALGQLIAYGEEDWILADSGGETSATRRFRFVPRHWLAGLLAWPILAIWFSQAVERHHALLRAALTVR